MFVADGYVIGFSMKRLCLVAVSKGILRKEQQTGRI